VGVVVRIREVVDGGSETTSAIHSQIHGGVDFIAAVGSRRY